MGEAAEMHRSRNAMHGKHMISKVLFWWDVFLFFAMSQEELIFGFKSDYGVWGGSLSIWDQFVSPHLPQLNSEKGGLCR